MTLFMTDDALDYLAKDVNRDVRQTLNVYINWTKRQLPRESVPALIALYDRLSKVQSIPLTIRPNWTAITADMYTKRFDANNSDFLPTYIDMMAKGEYLMEEDGMSEPGYPGVPFYHPFINFAYEARVLFNRTILARCCPQHYKIILGDMRSAAKCDDGAADKLTAIFQRAVSSALILSSDGSEDREKIEFTEVPKYLSIPGYQADAFCQGKYELLTPDTCARLYGWCTLMGYEFPFEY